MFTFLNSKIAPWYDTLHVSWNYNKLLFAHDSTLFSPYGFYDNPRVMVQYIDNSLKTIIIMINMK